MTMLNEMPTSTASTCRQQCFMLALVALLAACVMAYVTGNAMGVGVDSVDYIAGAWNLLAGNGLKTTSGTGALTPLTHFPPLTSLLLSIGQLLGIGVVRFGRCMNIFFFAASAFLAARIVSRHAKTVWPGVIAGLLVICNVDMLRNHSLIASEPPFFFLMLLSLWWLIAYLEEGRRRLLIAAAIAAGLSLLTRYPGVVLAGCGVIGILTLGPGSFKRRLIDAALFGVICTLPSIASTLHNLAVAGTAADREIAFHKVNAYKLRQCASTIMHWFVPDLVDRHHPKRLVAALLLAVHALLAVSWTRRPTGTRAAKNSPHSLSSPRPSLFSTPFWLRSPSCSSTPPLPSTVASFSRFTSSS